jgi:hypothetical protein
VLASNVDEESAKEQAGRIMDLLFDSRVVKKPACKPDLGYGWFTVETYSYSL